MIQTTHYNEEIRPVLIKVLTDAVKKIHLAIGWINDTGLEGLLQKKAIEGLEISLIVIKDQDQELKSGALKELSKKGVRVIALDNTHREQLIDHRFGVIDDSVVLNGNYTWGHKNAPEETYLSITKEVPTLASGFEVEFEYLAILNQLSKDEPKFPNPIIPLLKRMEIVKTFLKIGDTEYLHLHYKKLENYTEDKNVAIIYEHLENKSYEEALSLIKAFTLSHQSLRACLEPPIDNLQREIKLLEEEITSLSNEYNETQKKLHKFSKMHTDYLGALLKELLYQTKIKASIEAKLEEENEEKQEQYEEAKNDHEEYTKSYEVAKKQKLKTLTKAEQKELKKLYRKTSLKCHPDRVVDELHDQAEELFLQLNEAYKANDLERLREISQQLQPGIMVAKSEGITELKKLDSTHKSLLQKLQGWEENLKQLQQNPSYITIQNIEDWDVYFTEKQEILQKQLDRVTQFIEVNSVVLDETKVPPKGPKVFQKKILVSKHPSLGPSGRISPPKSS